MHFNVTKEKDLPSGKIFPFAFVILEYVDFDKGELCVASRPFWLYLLINS
jgi:hypothetical protein